MTRKPTQSFDSEAARTASSIAFERLSTLRRALEESRPAESQQHETQTSLAACTASKIAFERLSTLRRALEKL
jgi:hypothetical protein